MGRSMGAIVWCSCLLTAASCRDAPARSEASEQVVAAELTERMPAITRCWSAGHKRGSYLTGDDHLLRISILPNGTVKTAFADSAHHQHPVGSCVRSAFDGLRFAAQPHKTTIAIPLKLGSSVQTPGAGAPFKEDAAAP